MADADEHTVKPLLEPDFLQTLERLCLALAHPFPGRSRPRRRAPSSEVLPLPPAPATTPQELEIAALSHLFQGTLVEPQNLALHLLVDGSQSMAAPTGDEPGIPSKFLYARRLAGALGYAALMRYERVSVECFATAVGRRTPTLSSRDKAPLLLDYLQNIRGGGEGFARVLEHYATRNARPGICVVLSDFLDPQWEDGVRALLSRRFRVILLQVLSSAELSPHVGEDLRLVDAVTGQARDVHHGAQANTRYQAALNRFFGMLSEAAGKHGMGYLRITTNTDFEEPLLATLRRAQLSHQP